MASNPTTEPLISDGDPGQALAPPSPQSPINPPRARHHLDHVLDLRDAWRLLRGDRLFWAFLALKLLLSFLCGSHVATRWFGPFLHDFGLAPFADPWARYLPLGEPLAFPYGPTMLLGLGLPWLIAAPLGVAGSQALGLLVLRLPLLGADVLICLLLMSWLPQHARPAARSWWLNPVVLYATYVHGQLDLWPTALLCLSLHLTLAARPRWGALVLGLGLGAKLHLLVALPFVLIWLYKRRSSRGEIPIFVGILLATALACYLPFLSPAFGEMVLASPESARMWAVAIPFGPRVSLYLAPMALLLTVVRMASWQAVERDVALLVLGLAFLILVALVPPQPGWFVWSAPFVAYLAAQFSRTAIWSVRAMHATYLLYFLVAQPLVFFESLQPMLGADAGTRLATALEQRLPGLTSHHFASIAWTLLFGATTWTAWEMIRRGMRVHRGSRHEEPFLLGIGGDSGVGKHTLGRDLKLLLGDGLGLVDGDDDHRWERGDAAWKSLTHLDPRANRLHTQLEALQRLRQGADVRKPHYNHQDGRFTSPVLWPSARVFGLVGLHPFYLQAQRRLIDLKVYVDAEESVRRAWKIARDVAARGHTPERVLADMDRRQPDAARFVRPQQQYADLVVRHMHKPEDADAETVELEVELSGGLDPFGLLTALQAEPTLQVEWTPDEALEREKLRIRGRFSKEMNERLARHLLADPDEWLVAEPTWFGGQRGLGQLVMLHALVAGW